MASTIHLQHGNLAAACGKSYLAVDRKTVNLDECTCRECIYAIAAHAMQLVDGAVGRLRTLDGAEGAMSKLVEVKGAPRG